MCEWTFVFLAFSGDHFESPASMKHGGDVGFWSPVYMCGETYTLQWVVVFLGNSTCGDETSGSL